MFLIFGESEPRRSYKHGSYKKKCTLYYFLNTPMSYPTTPSRQLIISTRALEEGTGHLQPIRIDYKCYSDQSEKRI